MSNVTADPSGLDMTRLPQRLGIRPADVASLKHDAVRVGDRLWAATVIDDAGKLIRKHVADHHRAKPLDKVAFGNLTSVCTSLEAATRDPKSGKPAFDWQRIGDARYNMLVFLSNLGDAAYRPYGGGIAGPGVDLRCALVGGW